MELVFSETKIIAFFLAVFVALFLLLYVAVSWRPFRICSGCKRRGYVWLTVYNDFDYEVHTTHCCNCRHIDYEFP